MGEVHIKLINDHMPESVPELVEYLRTMACVNPDTGYRRMPNYVDDEVFDAAASEIERMRNAIEWCLDRDNRNGSLPEAYAERLRAILSARATEGE